MTEENNDILRGVWEIASFMGEDPRGLTANDIEQCPVPSFWDDGNICANKQAVREYLDAELKAHLTPTPITSFFLDEIKTIPEGELGRVFFEKFHPCTREDFIEGYQRAHNIAEHQISQAFSLIEAYRPA